MREYSKEISDKYKQRFWSRVEKRQADQCWIWRATLDTGGYGRMRIDGRESGAHRIAYMIEHGVSLKCDEICCHKCDNRRCVNPNHIFIGTRADNAYDRDRKQRQSKGIDRPMSKLTEEEVIEIRLKWKMGKSQMALAREYKVWQATVRKIVIGKAWKHVS